MEIGLVAFTIIAAAIIGVSLWFLLKTYYKPSAKPKAQKHEPTSEHHAAHPNTNNKPIDPYSQQAETAVKAVFNDEFREELRNRGRLHFEKIINENAMFLQQDLQLTTAQLNDYMKQEIINKLQEEFKKYEQSIGDAKQLALDSINKTQSVIEEQRKALSEEVKEQLKKDKEQMVKNFEQHMADIINHYVLQAIGDQIDLSAQLDFILSDLEANKQAIIEDINDGA